MIDGRKKKYARRKAESPLPVVHFENRSLGKALVLI